LGYFNVNAVTYPGVFGIEVCGQRTNDACAIWNTQRIACGRGLGLDGNGPYERENESCYEARHFQSSRPQAALYRESQRELA
jgi:hypothetical protein